jgi:NADPH2 dehydrogenase
MTSNAFSSFTLRGMTLKNRIVMSPMLMYAAGTDGLMNDKLFVHYGARALGGVGMIVTEVLAVEPRGRISASDLGLWSDAQIEGLRRMVGFAHTCGVKVIAQLAHAGRKSHLTETAIGPSAVVYDDKLGTPQAVTEGDIAAVTEAYRAAARRVVDAGFDGIEVHAANGYLLHSFLSPLANHRNDKFGGDDERRMRFPLEVVRAVRASLPDDRPLLYRMCADDVAEGGATLAQSLTLSKQLKAEGVDLIDVTTGNILPTPYSAPVYPGYQVRYAEAVRKAAEVATATSGSVASLDLIEEIIGAGRVDLVFMGRALMRDPFWAIEAARAAGVTLDLPMPTYARGTGPFERGF